MQNTHFFLGGGNPNVRGGEGWSSRLGQNPIFYRKLFLKACCDRRPVIGSSYDHGFLWNGVAPHFPLPPARWQNSQFAPSNSKSESQTAGF